MPVALTQPQVRHEEFCLPRPGADSPRLESYATYNDDPRTGRSAPTHNVVRCMECGAATYQQIGF